MLPPHPHTSTAPMRNYVNLKTDATSHSYWLQLPMSAFFMSRLHHKSYTIWMQHIQRKHQSLPQFGGEGEPERSERVGLGSAHLVVQLDVHPTMVSWTQLHRAHAVYRQRFQHIHAAAATAAALGRWALPPLVVLQQQVEGLPGGQHCQWVPAVTLWSTKKIMKIFIWQSKTV